MVTHPRRLAIEASGLDLGVHRESTSALPDGRLLEHGDDLLEQGRRFSLTRVQSPEDRRRRCECTDLQSCLAVMMINAGRFRNWSTPHLPPIANATNTSI